MLSEPIEWRTDGACGKAFESSLKLPARCNQPYKEGDNIENAARCCKYSMCTVDPTCDCPTCVADISIDDDDTVRLLNQYSAHIGIVNFFPVMFGLIQDPDQARQSLSVLADPNQMLSITGVRSLSKQDQFYLYKSNYWRGAVWINVNFLVLRGLFNNYLGITDVPSASDVLKVSQTINTGKELYNTVRERLIKSVYQNWRINHVFWEQYNDGTQLGQFTAPFNGWTSLILLVVAEPYG